MSRLLDEIQENYEKAGFRVVYKGNGAISLARKAPVVVVDAKGRPHLVRQDEPDAIGECE